MNDINDKNITSIDKENIFDTIDTQPNQLRQNFADTMRENITAQDGEGIKSVVFVGMGGSALAGDIVKNWLQNRLLMPFEVIRSSKLPANTDNHTLVIVSSYSGNTAETLSALGEATKYNAKIIGIGNGGKLQQLCQSHNLTYLQLPSVSQPRLAVFASLKALACVLEDTKIVNGDLRRELQDTADFLDTAKLAWSTDKQNDNLAQDTAKQLAGKPTLIYASSNLWSAAYKLKISINENAKQMAFADTFSELDHNEIEGWTAKNNGEFGVVVLESTLDNNEAKVRINLSSKIMKSQNFNPIKITAEGANLVQQILYCILFGDFVSAYMAIINGQDPTKVELIEEFKKDLDNSLN